MKVRDLISHLQNEDPEAEVVQTSEHGGTSPFYDIVRGFYDESKDEDWSWSPEDDEDASGVKAVYLRPEN